MDADLEYLGTSNAKPFADSLFKEYQSLNPSLTEKEWDQTQINFLKKHQYFTQYCKKTKEPAKLDYLKMLENGEDQPV